MTSAKGFPADKRCDCFAHIPVCGGFTPLPGCPIPNWTADCQKSAIQFTTTTCGAKSTVTGVDIVGSTAGKYGDIVTAKCSVGYYQDGGSKGLHYCSGTSWIPHGVYGAFPVCNIVTCNTPPKVLYADHVVTSYVYFNYGTYTCQQGTTQIGGSDGKIKCDIDGYWDTPTTPVPICQANYAFFKRVQSIEVNPNITLTVIPSKSSIYCSNYCLNSYMCLGFTFKSMSKECYVNNSGVMSNSTEMVQMYPY